MNLRRALLSLMALLLGLQALGGTAHRLGHELSQAMQPVVAHEFAVAQFAVAQDGSGEEGDEPSCHCAWCVFQALQLLPSSSTPPVLPAVALASRATGWTATAPRLFRPIWATVPPSRAPPAHG